MNEHTPGPWSFEVTGKNWYINSTDRQITCADEIDGEDRSNAHLIAAAPDMFGILKEINTRWLNVYPNGPNGSPDITGPTKDFWIRAIAAIAKAEGKS